MNIGKNLKKLLKDKDLKLTQVSRATHIPVQTLNNWMANQSPRNVTQLHTLCCFLGVSIEYLVFGIESPSGKTDLLRDALESETYIGKFDVILRRRKD